MATKERKEHKEMPCFQNAPRPRWDRGNTPPKRLPPAVFGLLVALALAVPLAGCRQSPDVSEGVELVMSSGSPTPAMTFELRFEPVMANGSQLGVPATNSPLLITPRLAGTFTWLSPRDGIFTPTEPLALDTRYEMKLRPDFSGPTDSRRRPPCIGP